MSAILAALLASLPAVKPVVFVPAAGTYSSAQSVVASTLSPGEAIYCCQGSGCVPARAAANRYTAPLTVSASTVVRCRAYAQGRQRSKVAEATYTMSSGGGGVTPAARYATLSSACRTDPFGTPATVRYVCDCQSGAAAGCVAGSDAATGLTPATAWRTFNKMHTAAGTLSNVTLAWCRGGKWVFGTTGEQANVSVGGNVSHSNMLVWTLTAAKIRDYVNPAASPVAPSDSTGDPWISVAQDMTPFYFSASNGVVIENLKLTNTAPAGSSWAFSDGGPYWGDGPSQNVTLCDVSIDSFNAGFLDYSADMGSGWQIKGSRITNSRQFGVLGNGVNFVIDGNYWANNGSDNMYDHTLYLQASGNGGDGGGPTLTGVQVINNEIHAGYNTSCTGSVIGCHGTTSGMLVENNLIVADGTVVAAPGCYGIDISNQGSTHGEWHDGLIIRGNTIKNVGGTFIGWESAPNAIIENNLMIQNNNTETVFLSEPVKGQRSIDHLPNNQTIRNNTIYETGTAGSIGIRVDRQALSGTYPTGLVITNNAIQYTPSSSSQGWVCLEPSGWTGGAGVTKIDNNLCYYGAYSSGSWADDGATWWSFASKPAWTGTAASKNVAPQFTAAGSDFTPASGSPLVGAGSATYFAPTDITGKARDASPDIGAYER